MAINRKDLAHEYTDKQIELLELRLAKLYRESSNEAQKKMQEHFAKFEKRDKEMLKKVKAGELTEKDYKQWRLSQIAAGQRWDAMSKQLADDYYKTDVVARQLVRDNAPKVYAENYNYNTYTIETQIGYDTSFTMYSEDAVRELIKEKPSLIYDPENAVSQELFKAKNQAYHLRRIQSETAKAIMLGTGINDLARSIAKSVGISDMKAATAYARTMMTRAQNMGRLASHERAKAMGIDCERQWVATLDMRTRHSHALLDGEKEGEDGKFSNGLRFPGDTESGDPAEYMNCRCTTIDEVDGIAYDMSFRSTEDLNGMTYDEWKEYHGKKAENGESGINKRKNTGTFKSSTLEKAMGDEYAGFANIASGKVNADLYGKYIDQSGATIKRKPNSGVYKSSLNEIEFDYNTHAGMNRYETLAHECGHLFDHQIGRLDGLSFTEIDKVNELCKIGSGVVKPLPEVVSSSDEFISALRKDMKAIEPNLTDICKELMETVEKRNATSGIQDALDGFYGTQKKGLTAWGHGNRYYDRRYTKMIKGFGHEQQLKKAYNELGYNVTSVASAKKMARQYDAASEAWANVNSAVTVGGDTLKYMEQYMPETVKVYKQIIKKVD